jgi:hypothetical protein
MGMGIEELVDIVLPFMRTFLNHWKLSTYCPLVSRPSARRFLELTVQKLSPSTSAHVSASDICDHLHYPRSILHREHKA